MTKPLLALVAALSLAMPAMAQGAPKPTPEQLAKTYEEDQLSLEKCGVPRNAADDYRPAPLTPDQTRAPRIKSSQGFKVDVVATGLPNAWGIGFLPSGNMIVAVKAQGLKTVSPKGVVSDLIAGTPPIKNSIALFGMHDVAIDKDFAKNRTIYLAYITTPEGATTYSGYIARAKLSVDEKSLTDFKILKEAPGFVPRRVVQAKDGTLMVLTADIITPYRAAQSMFSPNGKVLRINTDGSIPKDNPFVKIEGVDQSIYALGVRDPQGITFKPGTNDLYINENEPRGGDELNLIRAGKDYGFPIISYGRDNDGKLLNNGLTKLDGMEQPIHFWTPSVAFSGITFYTGNKLPGWKNSIFMGGLSGMQLVRLELNSQGRVVGEEKLLRDRCSRIRDVRQGPDGLLYLLTDAPNGEILRISPN
jgi:glucose/arabinose dehydrogenase